MNLPFVLSEGIFGEVGIRGVLSLPPDSPFLFETFVFALISPVRAIEAIPIELPLHVLATSTLYAFTLERTLRARRTARVATYPVTQLSALGMVHFLLGAPLMIFAIGIAVTALLRMRSSTEDGKVPSP